MDSSYEYSIVSALILKRVRRDLEIVRIDRP